MMPACRPSRLARGRSSGRSPTQESIINAVLVQYDVLVEACALCRFSRAQHWTDVAGYRLSGPDGRAESADSEHARNNGGTRGNRTRDNLSDQSDTGQARALRSPCWCLSTKPSTNFEATLPTASATSASGSPLRTARAGGGSWTALGPVLLSGSTARAPRIQFHRRPVFLDDRAPVNSRSRIAAAACRRRRGRARSRGALQLVQRQEALARCRPVAAHVAAGIGALRAEVPELGLTHHDGEHGQGPVGVARGAAHSPCQASSPPRRLSRSRAQLSRRPASSRSKPRRPGR